MTWARVVATLGVRQLRSRCILLVELTRFVAGLMSVAQKRAIKDDLMNPGLRQCIELLFTEMEKGTSAFSH